MSNYSRAGANQVEAVVIEMNERLRNLGPSRSSNSCCISKAPENIRILNEADFTPKHVSIGPYHRGNQRLKRFEQVKRQYLSKLLERNGVTLKICVKVLMKLVERAHNCYEAGSISNLNHNEFVMMILEDGGFIIELLLRSNDYQTRGNGGGDDEIFSKPMLLYDVKQDLILCENQLPLFVLLCLFNLTIASFTRSSCSFWDLVVHFFQSHNNQQKHPKPRSVKHFRDLVRTLHLPKGPWVRREFDSEVGLLYSASQLHEGGVKFKVGSSKCVLEIKFVNGILEIPRFKLDYGTRSLYANLVALELCHYPNKCYIINYIMFMVKLINCPGDVNLLAQEGIILNGPADSSSVVDLFKSISADVTVPNLFYFSRTCKDLNEYCNISSNKWKAAFKHKYFGTPLVTTATIIAVMYGVFNFIQTVCSAISAAKAR